MSSLMAWSIPTTEATSESAWLESSEVASHQPPQFQRPPRRLETHAKPRPTKSNHPAVKLYLHIGGNTLKAKWISCPVMSGLWSSKLMNLGGEELKPWNREKQKLREREEESERRERRKKRKSDCWNKIKKIGLTFMLQWAVIDNSSL